MERKPVTSSQIKEVGYDKETLTLEVEFIKGGIYTYQPVTKEAYKMMMSADSIGKFFSSNIKGNENITTTKLK
jgi:hypothetical protein